MSKTLLNVNTNGDSLLILNKSLQLAEMVDFFYGSNNTYDDDLHICEALTLT